MYKTIIKKVRHFLLWALSPIALLLAKFPRTSNRVACNACDKLLTVLKPGDIIVTRTNWLPTNLIIPGHYKHSVMYVGDEECIEAVLPVVHRLDLQELLGRISEYAVLRPTFADSSEMVKAVSKMNKLVGKPYDLYFEPGSKSFYCSEAIWFCYRRVVKNWAFTPRERMGVQTVTPNDFYLAKQYFKLIASH